MAIAGCDEKSIIHSRRTSPHSSRPKRGEPYAGNSREKKSFPFPESEGKFDRQVTGAVFSVGLGKKTYENGKWPWTYIEIVQRLSVQVVKLITAMILSAVQEGERNGVKPPRVWRSGLSRGRAAANVAPKVTSGDPRPLCHRRGFTHADTVARTYPRWRTLASAWSMTAFRTAEREVRSSLSRAVAGYDGRLSLGDEPRHVLPARRDSLSTSARRSGCRLSRAENERNDRHSRNYLPERRERER